MLSWADIEKARKRLEGVAHRTPVLRSRQFDAEAGATVFFKAENLQRGGAFKFRGAYNKMKAESEKGKVDAVVAFSSGNHAQAVALVSKLLGIRATVVMPTDAPISKIEATRGYGAEVVLYDRETQSRDDLAEQICREKGAVLVPPFDDELVMAGAATGAVELLEEIRDIDALVVPVSGGGLIGGWAIAARHLRPEIRIYGVEPESADDMRRSLEAGSRVTVAENPTVADGLRVTTPGRLTFPIVQEQVEEILLVSDAEMIETLTWMLERMKVLIEPSGVAAAAAVRHKKADFAGRRVGVVLSGGNVDLSRLSEFVASRARA
jgi:threo-3-hydroxy-L-aspartate ammonia-lyase